MHVMDIDFDLLVIKLPCLEQLASANLAKWLMLTKRSNPANGSSS